MALNAGIGLRAAPYPYRAMLAIANDIDEATWEEFVLLHEFLNTGNPTRLGRGLDLEIADSFFFYGTTSPEKRATFTYFADCDPGRRAACADQMDRLIEAGYLDCLHSWGDFSRTGGFRRELAASASTVLRRHGNVRVWINHGDDRNEQKAGLPGWADRSAPHGHADIALDAGLRFFWTGTLTSVVGQDTADTWRDRLQPARLMDDFVRPARKASVRDLNLVRFFDNHLIKPAMVGGRGIRVFQRYGFWTKPTASDLGAVIAPRVLDTLERRGGVMAVYTHLFRRHAGTPLDRVDWSPLVELASRHHRGRIQVTTTARLLTYVEQRKHLRWMAHERNGDVDIAIAGSPAIEDLRGVTFYVPDARRASLSLDGEPLTIQRNPPDETGRESVSMPWPPLSFPRGIHPVAEPALGARA